MRPLNVVSLFAGIGGLELGLERAGMTVVGQVELDDYCRRVLAKHWPDVPRHDDVRTAADWWLSEERPEVDVICGGFPCQPFSGLGNRLGIADERWGWPWMADVVRHLRPRYVVVENVPALLRDSDAFGWMLGDLAADGFDADWDVLSACSFGAPHTRERLFLVANSKSGHGEQPVHLSAAVSKGRPGARAARGDAWRDGWLSEPDVGRVAHGLPKRMVAADLHAFGNAVVPQVAEHVGRLIVEHAALSLSSSSGSGVTTQ